MEQKNMLPGLTREAEEQKLQEIIGIAQQNLERARADIRKVNEDLEDLLDVYEAQDKEGLALWNNATARLKENEYDLVRYEKARRKPYFGRIDFTDPNVKGDESYPVIWKNREATPKLCFMGCPHMSLHQLIDWTERVEQGLKAAGNKKVVIPTVFTAAPAVIEKFNATPYATRLKETGVIVSYICPLMYMNNPLSGKIPVITSSNKLRTYTSARYYTDDEILAQITKGGN